MKNKLLAQIAYEAYAAHQDWKNYAGNPIPDWEQVRNDIKEAWQAAVDAVLETPSTPEG